MNDTSPPKETLTPERFLREYYPSLSVPVYEPDRERGEHTTAFRDACANHGLGFQKTDERKYDIVHGTDIIGRLSGMVTNLVTRQADFACRDKAKTVAHLIRAKVPVPEQSLFLDGELQRALELAQSRCFNIVVKPCFGAGGRGITTDVDDEEGFRRAWTYACDSLSHRRLPQILIESKCSGIDIRAMVVAGRFSCAATRIPANVVGDGLSKVSTLIERKNAQRLAHPYHSRYPIEISDRLVRRLADRGLCLDVVLPDGEPLILSGVSNIHDGGDACEITDLVPAHIRETAERAASAVPGLGVAGVDLMVSTLCDSARAVVLEMNVRANFAIHYAPFDGNAA